MQRKHMLRTDTEITVELIGMGRISRSTPSRYMQLEFKIKNKKSYRIESIGFRAIVSSEEEVRSSYSGHHSCPPHELVSIWIHFYNTQSRIELLWETEKQKSYLSPENVTQVGRRSKLKQNSLKTRKCPIIEVK